MQFCPARHDFAHAFARKFERARKRLFAVFRKLREHRRKKFRRRLGFYSLGGPGVRIEFGWRKRFFALCKQGCICENQIIFERKNNRICLGARAGDVDPKKSEQCCRPARNRSGGGPS